MDIKTFGNYCHCPRVNNDVWIRIFSGDDPTPGANARTITFNIHGSDEYIINSSSIGIHTKTHVHMR